MRILAAFSPRASRSDRVKFLFDVYDTDGDGVVSREDLELMLRQLAGASLRWVRHHVSEAPTISQSFDSCG